MGEDDTREIRARPGEPEEPRRPEDDAGEPQATARVARGDQRGQGARDADPEIAKMALSGLASAAPDRAAGLVADAARADDAQMRLTAVEATRSLDSTAAAPILLAALRDSDVEVTRLAAAQLGNVGTPEAQAALVELMTRESAPPELQRAAADALASAGGEVAAQYADVVAKLRTPQAGLVVDGDTY